MTQTIQNVSDTAFMVAGFRALENDRPKPRWKELDLRLHEVAQHPLLNKPSGDLE